MIEIHIYQNRKKPLTFLFLQNSMYSMSAGFKCFTLIQTHMYNENSLEGYICQNIQNLNLLYIVLVSLYSIASTKKKKLKKINHE